MVILSIEIIAIALLVWLVVVFRIQYKRSGETHLIASAFAKAVIAVPLILLVFHVLRGLGVPLPY